MTLCFGVAAGTISYLQQTGTGNTLGEIIKFCILSVISGSILWLFLRWSYFVLISSSRIHANQISRITELREQILQLQSDHERDLQTMRAADQKQIDDLSKKLQEKQKIIDAIREPVFDMSGEAVVDYMFRNTEYQTTDEIGIALSVAAHRKQIAVMATRVDDFQPLLVDSTVFLENSFWLLSQNTSNEGIVFNVQRQYDESGHYMAYPPGGCIWGRTDHKILYERPKFCRAQIEAHRWLPEDII